MSPFEIGVLPDGRRQDPGERSLARSPRHCAITRSSKLPPDEPGAANILRIGDTVLMPAAFPHTREIVRREGLDVRTVDISELMKAEAAVTCSSVIFE